MSSPGPSISRKRHPSELPPDLQQKDAKKFKPDVLSSHAKDKKRRKKKKKKKLSIVATLKSTVRQKQLATTHVPSNNLEPEVALDTEVIEDTEELPGSPKMKDNGPSDLSSTQDATVTRLTNDLQTQTLLVQQHRKLFTQIQQSLTCQICLDLLYKPFALSPCGHVACYNCLVGWFTATAQEHQGPQPATHIHKRKTCPHCRVVVRDRPVEVWGIKSMVAGVIDSGLWEGGLANSPAEQETTTADPWRNIFREPFKDGPNVAVDRNIPVEDIGMYDEEDGGVYRCLDCMHEIWDGVCSSCHRIYPAHEDMQDDDDDFFPHFLEVHGFGYDSEDEDEGEGAAPLLPVVGGIHLHDFEPDEPFGFGWHLGEDDSDEDFEGSFIDDEEDVGIPHHNDHPEVIDVDGSEDEHSHHRNGRLYSPVDLAGDLVLISSDDEDIQVVARRLGRRNRVNPVHDEDDELEIQEVTPAHGHRRQVIDSEDENEVQDDMDDDSGSEENDDFIAGPAQHLLHLFEDGDPVGDHGSEEEEDDYY